jgi:hypothetical protein
MFLAIAWILAAIWIWYKAPDSWQWYGKLLVIAILGAVLSLLYYCVERLINR